MTAEEPILRISDLSRSVNTSDGAKTLIDNITFSFEGCRLYTVLGPSGAGKSSLLRLLNRLDEPTSGLVQIEGEDYRRWSPCELRRKVGYLFQAPYLFDKTVADNLLYADPNLTREGQESLLATTSVEADMLNRPVASLSVGQKQRIALARLLATRPSVLLLDEPTSALDPTYTQMIEKTIRNLVTDKKLTVIMVSHHPRQAVRMNGTGMLLVNGKLVESGPIKEMVENPATEEGRKYRDRELT